MSDDKTYNASEFTVDENPERGRERVPFDGREAQAPDGWQFDGWSPAHPELTGPNGLTRTNFFNGRYLDAEAFKRDQQWVGERDKLLAQTEHAGIAWGLGLKLPREMRRDKTASERVLKQPRKDISEFEELLQGADHSLSDLTDAQKQAVLEMLRQSGGDCPTTQRTGRLKGPQFGADTPVWLKPGVAFDSEGRPIQVEGDFEFTFAALLEEYANNPRIAVPPKTRFQPCMCIESTPGKADAGPGPESGAYILVIAPREFPKGRARVYGDPCAKDKRIDCEADAWRGGFTLSLVKFPAPDARVDDVGDVFALRGAMAAYYFDTWEKRWESRWSPQFGHDDRFCRALGPFQRTPGAIALALIYVGTSNDVIFVDPWIPRRYQVSSGPRAWEALVRGAPTPAASVARRHQFQCQLDDVLYWWKRSRQRMELHEVAPAEQLEQAARIKPDEQIEQPAPAKQTDQEDKIKKPAPTRPFMVPPNLYKMGFRHIPPCGFLPVEISRDALDRLRNGNDRWPDEKYNKTPTSQQRSRRMVDHAITHYALQLGRQYFAGTNVFTHARVAVYEDDIFEEMQRVREKDPIRLKTINSELWHCINRAINPGDSLARATGVGPMPGVGQACPPQHTDFEFIRQGAQQGGLGGILANIMMGLIRYLENPELPITLHAFANHEIEWVDIVAPLYGRDFVGERESADDRRLRKYYAERGIDRKDIDKAMPDFDPASAVRPFVFYVKRRILLSEWVYMLIDTLLDKLDRMRRRVGQRRLSSLSAEEWTHVLAPVFGESSAIDSVATSDTVLTPTATATAIKYPELRAPATLAAYDRELKAEREQLLKQGLDEMVVTQQARARAIDTMSATYPGFNSYKTLMLVSPDAVDGLHRRLKKRAADTPAGESNERTMLERAFYDKSYQPGVNAAANDAIAEARRAFGERAVDESSDDIKMNALLRRRGVDLADLVGDQAEKVERSVVREGRKIVRAINDTAEDNRLQDAAFWKEWDAAMQSEKSPKAALDKLEKRAKADQGTADTRLTNNLRTLAGSLGEQGFERVMNRLRRSRS